MSGDDAGRQAGRLLDGSTWLGSARLDMVGFYGGDASARVCVGRWASRHHGPWSK